MAKTRNYAKERQENTRKFRGEYKGRQYPSTPSTREINRMDSKEERHKRIRRKLKEAGY